MAKHQGLGRGLGALMEDAESEEFEATLSSKNSNISAGLEQTPAVQEAKPVVKVTTELPPEITADENGTLWINPNVLVPNPQQPRTFFDEEKLAELTESVRQEGVLSPIIIEAAANGIFYIIAGERRTRAARAAGLTKVPVQLRKYTDVRKLEVALIENIQRTDLNPVEEAIAYGKLMELGNLSQDEMAQRVGKNRSTVANSLRLLKLPEDMQKALAQGTITSGHARALLAVDNSTDQRVLFGKIIGQGLSVRQCEAMATELNGGIRAKKKDTPKPVQDERDPNYVDIENKFIERLGTKVQLKGDFESGTITINYFSKDDLNRIYDILLGSNE